MPIRWSTELDVKLFLALVEETGMRPNYGVWENIAKKMGEGFTNESVRQRFNSLKRNSADAHNKNDGATASAPGSVKTEPGQKGKKGKAPAKANGTTSTASKVDVKKRKQSSDDEQYQPLNYKKVKKEPGTDEIAETDKDNVVADIIDDILTEESKQTGIYKYDH